MVVLVGVESPIVGFCERSQFLYRFLYGIGNGSFLTSFCKRGSESRNMVSLAVLLWRVGAAPTTCCCCRIDDHHR